MNIRYITILFALVMFTGGCANKEMIQSLGHRIYSEFVRSKPRDQWTDELFVSELIKFLNKQKIMKEDIKFAIDRVKEFKSSGILMSGRNA